MTICRHIPYQVADGPHNMAADEVLLESAIAGAASLRFYGWLPATLSLGYFQRTAFANRMRSGRSCPMCVGRLAAWRWSTIGN